MQEDAPTQLFTQGTPNSGPFSSTSPLPSGGRTDSVRAQPATAYQPHPSNSGSMPAVGFQQTQTSAGFQQTSPFVGQPFGSQPLSVGTPARKGRGWTWLIALLVVFVIGVGALGGAGYMWWHAKHQAMVKHVIVDTPRIPDVNIPNDLGAKIKQAMKDSGLPKPLDESGAIVTGTDTVITKTFQIGDDGTFSVRGLVGNFTITGTDDENAEVKITKHGGSPQERNSVPVLLSETDGHLSLVAGPPSGDVEVTYEIKLPRDLQKVDINSEHGNLKFADFSGALNVNLHEGHLEFRDVTGSVHSKLLSGDTKVMLDKAERDAAQEFSVVNGDIEMTIADGTDADLKGETLAGEINVDDRYGLKSQKRTVGQTVTGQLGDGGASLELKVVHGDIKLKK